MAKPNLSITLYLYAHYTMLSEKRRPYYYSDNSVLWKVGRPEGMTSNLVITFYYYIFQPPVHVLLDKSLLRRSGRDRRPIYAHKYSNM